MSIIYVHTQRLPKRALIGAGTAALALGLTPPGLLLRALALSTMGGALAMMRSLTVLVGDGQITINFGEGILKKQVSLDVVVDCRVVRTHPLNGRGVHWMGNGWLYNIYGLDAVELKLVNGRVALIGTDEPDRLSESIKRAIQANTLSIESK